MEGYVVGHRDMFWAGVSTYLIIEQVLMRSTKTHGEDTRQEVGMTGNQRSVWVLSMPVCADFKQTMHEYCCVSYETRHQNNDITSSYSRDPSDTIDQIDYRNETTRLF